MCIFFSPKRPQKITSLEHLLIIIVNIFQFQYLGNSYEIILLQKVLFLYEARREEKLKEETRRVLFIIDEELIYVGRLFWRDSILSTLSFPFLRWCAWHWSFLDLCFFGFTTVFRSKNVFITLASTFPSRVSVLTRAQL